MEDIIAGIKSNYHISGRGDRWLLFLHGWGTDHKSFMPVIDKINSRYRILAPDLPGFGGTDEPDTIFGVDDYATYVKALLDKLDIHDPVVIGHSNGGRIAAALAEVCRIDKMILVDSAGIKPKRTLSYHMRVCMYKTVKRVLLALGRRELLKKYSKNKGSEDYIKASDKMKAVMSRLINEDMQNRLVKLDIPVLLFWGEKDTATPYSDAVKMNSLIRDSGIVTVKNGGHYSFLDDPGLFIKVLDKFLEG